MKKTFKIVMLPSEKASDITLSPLKTKLRFKDEHKLNSDKYQHLYIISDKEIKEGDWYIHYNSFTKDYIIFKSNDEFNSSNNPNVIDTRPNIHTYWNKKLIASTDKSLQIRFEKLSQFHGEHIAKDLPQIPESFIQAYIKAYNEGKPITEVVLEMEDFGREEWHGSNEDGEPVWHEDIRVSTNPDNTVIIQL